MDKLDSKSTCRFLDSIKDFSQIGLLILGWIKSANARGILKDASRCFMFMYCLLPYWILTTWCRQEQTSIRAELLSELTASTRDMAGKTVNTSFPEILINLCNHAENRSLLKWVHLDEHRKAQDYKTIILLTANTLNLLKSSITSYLPYKITKAGRVSWIP